MKFHHDKILTTRKIRNFRGRVIVLCGVTIAMISGGIGISQAYGEDGPIGMTHAEMDLMEQHSQCMDDQNAPRLTAEGPDTPHVNSDEDIAADRAAQLECRHLLGPQVQRFYDCLERQADPWSRASDRKCRPLIKQEAWEREFEAYQRCSTRSVRAAMRKAGITQIQYPKHRAMVEAADLACAPTNG